MNQMLRLLAFVVALGLSAHAAESAATFTQTLNADQKKRLGLDSLTPEQQAGLDAAVAAYLRGEKTVAVEQAVAEVRQQAEVKIQQAEKKAAETAVAEYQKRKEPGVIARTLDRFKHQQEEAKRERFTARVVGEFRGWSGGTYFPLADGQVWRQTGSENYEFPPVQNAELEFYKSSNGYWRMKYGGAWITVKRVQ